MPIKERFGYDGFGTKTQLSSGGIIDYRPSDYYSEKLRTSYSGKHQAFDSDNVHESGGVVNGQAAYWDEAWNSYQLPMGSWWYPALDVVEPSGGELAAQLIAATDPTQPDVDIANFIGELKDLPGMIKSIGDSFLNKGVAYAFGHLNLSYKFGWAPFARDVVAMMDFQRLAARRFEVLRRLKDNGTTIRKKHLFKGKDEKSMNFDHAQFSFVSKTSMESDISGYTIWGVTDEMPSTDEALHSLAMQQALGLSMRAEVAWNLLPWSWLIDWFSNVGTFLAANRNRTGVELRVANIVRKRVWESECTGQTAAWATPYFQGSISPRTRKYIIHERYGAGNPSVSAHLPILNMGQVGILASIKATRR